MDDSLESNSSKLTNYKRLLSQIEVGDDGKHYYQSIKPKRFNATKKAVSSHYQDTIVRISDSMENRFQDIMLSPVKNQITLLDTSTWPKDELSSFGEEQVSELLTHFHLVLKENKCDTFKAHAEWGILKGYVIPIVANNPKADYLDV